LPMQKKFEVLPLAYPYNALEPYIDAETVRIHHDNHYKTYVDRLNAALENYPMYQSWSLERLLKNIGALPPEIQTAVKNNGGGAYNHGLYFSIMGPPQNKMPEGKLKNAIDQAFGSFDAFQQEFGKSALDQFGSGYAWLVAGRDGRLFIKNTANQDTVLPLGFCPVILIDVWEHAYYLKYQYRRADYIKNWFNVVDWDKAGLQYDGCLKKPF